MSFHRILVAVDDSPAALRAARLAIDLARGWGAAVRVVTVTADHEVDALLDGDPEARVRERAAEASSALLRHLADDAAHLGLDHDARLLQGTPFRMVLEAARDWEADLIIMGRSDRRGPSSPYLGSVTAHVLEFADCPVLVVPASSSPGTGATSAG